MQPCAGWGGQNKMSVLPAEGYVQWKLRFSFFQNEKKYLHKAALFVAFPNLLRPWLCCFSVSSVCVYVKFPAILKQKTGKTWKVQCGSVSKRGSAAWWEHLRRAPATEADGVILPVLDDAEQHGRCELSCQWASRTVADSSVKSEA